MDCKGTGERTFQSELGTKRPVCWSIVRGGNKELGRGVKEIGRFGQELDWVG